jgi:predicted nucleic acid-binding protein
VSADLLGDIAHGAVIGLDTAPFIYLVEAHPLFGPVVRPLFEERLDTGINTAVTSVISLSEALVLPLGQERIDLVASYRALLQQGTNLVMSEVTAAIAERAAALRAQQRIRLPDALQLATAIEHHAAVFVTNDDRLRRIDALRVLVLADYAPRKSVAP